MKIGTWLLSLISPFMGKILASIGFSVVTITGMGVILDQVKQQFVASANAMPADVINLFLLAGGGQAIGMVTGALTTKFLLWQISNSSKILGWNPG